MGDLGIRTGFNNSFTDEKKRLLYPYLYVPRFEEEIALMITCLEPEPLPIVLSDSRVLKRAGPCVASALELTKLLRVYQFEVVLSKTNHRAMRGISDILEVLLWVVLSPSL